MQYTKLLQKAAQFLSLGAGVITYKQRANNLTEPKTS